MGQDPAMLAEMLANVRSQLLAARTPAGHWVGQLSSSALSTATASFALARVDPARCAGLIARGLTWLLDHQNADGGWGDTTDSLSNISTTMLCWAALTEGPAGQGRFTQAIAAAEAWLSRAAGSTRPDDLAAALARRYGADRTFSAPILAMVALSGRLGPASEAWRRVNALPFELAALPHRWLQFLRLPVVSYALPALIAIGQARHHFAPSANPIARLLRHALCGRTLKKLGRIQPPSGGFLEAAPLTSFVTMCLAVIGRADNPVVARGVEFLVATARPDGSWPIDTNLATWLTSLSIRALSAGEPAGGPFALSPADRAGLTDWLLAQQHRVEHPYTHAAPGGWAWTDLSGGVPDADDTAAALLALRAIWPGQTGPSEPVALRRAVAAAVGWLVDLQNRDGGMPTFCRGWGALPFDRSAADLTAHALSAWAAWRDDLPIPLRARVDRATDRAVRFLARAQQPDGAWTPLWFGNQHESAEQNPTYGTARVLTGLSRLAGRWIEPTRPMRDRAASWLLAAQNGDGGWGGGPGCPSSIEETAVAVDALAGLPGEAGTAGSVEEAIDRAVAWLLERTDCGRALPAAPIGLYFARLWYSERLYPAIFLAQALGRVVGRRPVRPAPSASRRG